MSSGPRWTHRVPIVTRGQLNKAKEAAAQAQSQADDYFKRLMLVEDMLAEMDSKIGKLALENKLLKTAVKRLLQENKAAVRETQKTK